MSEPTVQCLCRNAREAFHYDQADLASATWAARLTKYARDLRYNALVNFRLSQYFFHRSRALLAAMRDRTHADRHVLRRTLLRRPDIVLKYGVAAMMFGYFNRANYRKHLVDISPYADIDRNLWGMFRNICITAETRIGRNAHIEANVTIGSLRGVIGDNVLIHTGAVLAGHLEVGDNVVIGANSLVVGSVPSNTTVAGVPAKVVFRKAGQPAPLETS